MANIKSFKYLFLAVLGAACFYFVLMSATLSAKIKNLRPDYERITQENLENKNNFLKLQKEFQAINADRDNLLMQVKGLFIDKGYVKELESSLEKSKNDVDGLNKEKETALKQNNDFKKELGQVRVDKDGLLQEKEKLEQALAKEKDKSPIKNLERRLADLQKENKILLNQTAQAKETGGKASNESAKAKNEAQKARKEAADKEVELRDARQRIEKLNKNYAEALKKNKLLEQKVIETPKKFAEIARQNKILVRQTANMHYNLGVFYTKNKEYPRATAEFEKALELTPDDAYAHFNLGYIYAEYLVNRPGAIEHFRHFLRLAKTEDKDVDWVRKYIITWEAYDGKKTME